MQNIKKQIIFIFYMICMLFLLNAENNKISELTSIEYCTITFTSDISTYYSEIKIKKNTRLSLNEFPKLTNSKYMLTGWKYNDNMQFEAIWEDDRNILKNAGKISAEIAKDKAESEFEIYRIIQYKIFKSDFDLFAEETAKLEKN